jgi:hypothetical protein
MQWRWDSWYCQPWAWLWSDLERDRLGRWLGLWIGLIWILPAWIIGQWIGVGMALSGLIGIPLIVHRRASQRANRTGWQTFIVVPTSWAVRRATERWIWHDPTHWAQIPHYERHTRERRWNSARSYRQVRQAEWQMLIEKTARQPESILIAQSFATVGSLPMRWRRRGTPFAALPRRAGRTLTHVQHRMFGQSIPRRGPPVSHREAWTTVTLPLMMSPSQRTFRGFPTSSDPPTVG